MNIKKTLSLLEQYEVLAEKLEKLETAEQESHFCLHNDVDHGLCMDCGTELDYDSVEREGA